MPLHIGKVNAEVDIMRAADPAALAAPAASASPGVSQAGSVDVDWLRAMVLQILSEELASFQRQQG